MIVIWTLKIGGSSERQQNLARDIINEFAKPGRTLEVLVLTGQVDMIVILRDYTNDRIHDAWKLHEKLKEMGSKYLPLPMDPTAIANPHICSTSEGFSVVWASAGGVPRLILDFKEKLLGRQPALEKIERICSRFHMVTRQLQDRQNKRKMVKIRNEYDAQKLLLSLLTVDFDDIRIEEPTPSIAGGSSRMDFVLRNEQTVIETKMTRKGLGAKQLGEELIKDIVKYKNSPDCKNLVCFVYDPEGRIQSPRAVEADLERVSKDIRVRVLIRPTGE